MQFIEDIKTDFETGTTGKKITWCVMGVLVVACIALMVFSGFYMFTK